MTTNIRNAPERGRRVINYLRLSVTDRCNLRCMYCMPEEGVNFVPHDAILSYEEMLHLVELCVRKGIRKVRLTGGEPLVRKGFMDFLKNLGKTEGLDEISLTTNGVLLKEFAAGIREAGILRVNISLDTLQPERFFRITGRDLFKQVWEGILEAEQAGFNPIKINVVAIKGVNDDEIVDFASLTFEKPYHIRFIEHMPINGSGGWGHDRFISSNEILNKVESLGEIRRIENGSNLDGPANRFIFKKGIGEIGLIEAMSNHFCGACNRLRLTADGHLRSCLFSDNEIDIIGPLRQGKDDDTILELIEKAIGEKPENHEILSQEPRKCVRRMSSIGG